jgi:hypothetical protein
LADRDHRAPLREPGAELVVLLEALAKAVEPLGDGLALGARERLGALVDLDPRDDPASLQELGKRRAVRGALADRLVEEMCSSLPSVVKSISRYARRFSSVDSTPMESKRFLIVPSLSSAARIPFPGATRAFAISSRLVSVTVAIRASFDLCGGLSPEPTRTERETALRSNGLVRRYPDRRAGTSNAARRVVAGGFLGEDERLEDVLHADRETLKELGLTLRI